MKPKKYGLYAPGKGETKSALHYNVNSLQTIGWPDPFPEKPESEAKQEIPDYNKWCRKTNLNKTNDDCYYESVNIVPNRVIENYYNKLLNPE